MLALPEVQYLGEIVGRVRRLTLDHHKLAIRDFPEPIRDIPHLRKFLGVVNWVRPHLPAEFAQVLKPLLNTLARRPCGPCRRTGKRL